MKASMNLQKQLDKAIAIASQTHFGQFDRGGRPYILHPLHLMNQFMFEAIEAAHCPKKLEQIESPTKFGMV